MAQPAEPASWWEAFPEYKAACPRIEPEEVKELIEAHSSSENKSKTFLLVDVRRTDWEGGTVATSINLPAHTLYQTRPVIYQLCKQAGIETIIFYCGKSEYKAKTGPSFLDIGLTNHRLLLVCFNRQLQRSRSEIRRLDAGLLGRGW